MMQFNDVYWEEKGLEFSSLELYMKYTNSYNILPTKHGFSFKGKKTHFSLILILI